LAENFEVLPYRFRFRAIDPVSFPPGKAGNVIRGAFGTIFRELACTPDCPGAERCPRRAECAYARLFEPAPAGPSGFANPPRPFVFRPLHLDGRTIPRHEPFVFDVHLFETRFPALPWFQQVFERVAASGLGPGRGRASLESIDAFGPGGTPVTIDLAQPGPATARIRVRFLTPTELKADGAVSEQPEFSVLFARIRDRVSSLRTLYGSGPIDVDFRGLGQRAANIQMTHCARQSTHIERFSTRTGQTHPLGGFIGEAEYQGDLAEFVPWLEAATWTGVGRQTVWGKGAIDIHPVPPAQKPGNP
jgi:hypothetical protein